MYSRALLIEEAWDRDMARYDDVRERYHREIEDIRREGEIENDYCLLYTSPSPRDRG